MAKVLGLKELERKLQRLPDKVRGRTLDKGVREASKLVVARAKTLVPVDSGALRDSLTTIKNSKESKTGRFESSQYSVSWLKFVWYGGFQELGTSKNPAHKFIRGAIDIEEDNAVDKMAEVYRNALKNV